MTPREQNRRAARDQARAAWLVLAIWASCAAALIVMLTAIIARAEAVNLDDLDTFDLEHLGEHAALLTYYNSAGMNSRAHPGEMSGDGFTIRLQLSITPDDEVLTVYPSEGWFAIPETISVPDGETGQIMIIEYIGG